MSSTRFFSKINGLLLILLLSFPYGLNGCTPAAVLQSSALNQPQQNAVGYYLPKGLIHLKINEKEKDYEITFTVKFVPDENYLYTLTYLPKGTAEDTIEIKVGSNGLLAYISTTTDDKMPMIVQKIAELVPTALKSFIPVARATKSKFKIKHIDVWFDPSDMRTVNKLKDRFKKEQGAIFEVEPLFVEKQYPSEPFPSSHAVYYRLVLPYRISLRFESDNNCFESSEILYIPNRFSPILSHEIKRANFVKKEQTLTFLDGVLTESKIVKPSEVLGFMSIPLEVAKAIVAVPGSILKFRIDTTTKSKELVTAQKDLVTAQRELFAAQKELINEQRERFEALDRLRKTEDGKTHDAPKGQ